MMMQLCMSARVKLVNLDQRAEFGVNDDVEKEGIRAQHRLTPNVCVCVCALIVQRRLG